MRICTIQLIKLPALGQRPFPRPLSGASAAPRLSHWTCRCFTWPPDIVIQEAIGRCQIRRPLDQHQCQRRATSQNASIDLGSRSTAEDEATFENSRKIRRLRANSRERRRMQALNQELETLRRMLPSDPDEEKETGKLTKIEILRLAYKYISELKLILAEFRTNEIFEPKSDVAAGGADRDDIREGGYSYDLVENTDANFANYYLRQSVSQDYDQYSYCSCQCPMDYCWFAN